MKDLCTGCLLPGRKLWALDDEKTKLLYAQLLMDSELEVMCDGFRYCFECVAAVNKFDKFRKLTLWAVEKILNYRESTTNPDLSDRPNYHKLDKSKTKTECDINLSNSFEVKLESTNEQDIFSKDIKDENDSDIDVTDILNNDMHNEPETFVNDLIVINSAKNVTNNIKNVNKNNDSAIIVNATNDFDIITAKNIDNLDHEIKSKHKKDKSKLKSNKISKNKTKKYNKKKQNNSKNEKCNYQSDISDPESTCDSDDKDYQIDDDHDTDCSAQSDSINTKKVKKKNINLNKEKSKNINLNKEKSKNINLNKAKSKNINLNKEKSKNINVKIDKLTLEAKVITKTLSIEQVEEEREAMLYETEYSLSHFKCNSCIIGFDSKPDYDVHYSECHDESVGPHECAVCGRRFAAAASLASHALAHFARYKCSLCKESSANKDDIEAHLLEHAEFSCELCGQVFGTSLQQQAHLSKAHGLRQQCAHCPATFSSQRTLRYHLKVLHKGQNRHPCGICGKVYQWKSNLFRHIKNHKAQSTGELHCAPCNKTFSSVATLRQHLASNKRHVSAQDYSFSCGVCSRRFALARDLRDHENWEHLQRTRHVCATCCKPFKSHMALYLHQNVHKDKSALGYLCHMCGKSYPSASKLSLHVGAAHCARAPHRCALCAAAFTWRSSLQRHLAKIHALTKEQYKAKKQKLSEELPAMNSEDMGLPT